MSILRGICDFVYQLHNFFNMKVTLLLTKSYRPISVAAILDVFETVNSFYLQDGREAFFEIELTGEEGTPPIHSYNFTPLPKHYKTDIIFIPAFLNGDVGAYLESNGNVIPWLHHQYIKEAEIASFCTGALLLAASGLLDGKKATTHELAVPEIRKNFPKVLLEENAVITDDNGIYTSGGATSSFHLMLYLIEKYCGWEKAVKTAKFFAIDMDRHIQTYFSSFKPDRKHDDKIVAQAQQGIEGNYFKMKTIEEIISDLPVSRRNFIRRFKNATGITPIEYLQNTRIEAAKKILENTNHPVSEVLIEVGYSDVKAFRKIFRRITGITPRDYQDKYRSKKKNLLPV